MFYTVILIVSFFYAPPLLSEKTRKCLPRLNERVRSLWFKMLSHSALLPLPTSYTPLYCLFSLPACRNFHNSNLTIFSKVLILPYLPCFLPIAYRHPLRPTVCIQDLLIEENDASSDGGEVWREVADAFAWGLSCGSASCLNSANSVFAPEDAEELYKGVTFLKI